MLNQKQIDINYVKWLLQESFSDILIHIGQSDILKRINENPIAGEDFSQFEIKTELN